MDAGGDGAHYYYNHYPDRVKIAVIIQIVLSSLACIFSVSIILGVTIPLLRKDGRNRVSTYNLYLVFSSIPDLVYNIFLVYMFATYERWTDPPEPDDDNKFPYIDHPFDMGLFLCCGTSVFYVNAIIAYEIMKLLRNSKQRRRYKAPSLKAATIQAGCAYLFAVVHFLLEHYLSDRIPKWARNWIGSPYYLIATVLLPGFYILFVCFRICREGLFCLSSRAGKRLTVLVRYFARIIVIYGVIWPPMYFIYVFGSDPRKEVGLLQYAAACIFALQVFASFAFSLTKPDVRRDVLSLFGCREEKRPGANGRDATAPASDAIDDDTAAAGSSAACRSGCADPRGTVESLRDDHRPDPGAPTTTPVPDRGDDSATAAAAADSNPMETDVNTFDFAGADAPAESDPRESRRLHRISFRSRRNTTFGFVRRQEEENPSRPDSSSTIQPHAGGGTVTGTSRADENRTVSEPFTFADNSIRGSFTRLLSSITGLANPAGRTRTRPTRPMPGISSGEEEQLDGNRAGFRKLTIVTETIDEIGDHHRSDVENTFGENNNNNNNNNNMTPEKIRDETI